MTNLKSAKYRLTEDWLEYKKGHVFDMDGIGEIGMSRIELSLLLKTGILEEVKEPPICTREHGCGLAFIQGRECYDGEPCEDVREGVEMPKLGDQYWYVSTRGEVDSLEWGNYDTDRHLKSIGNCFASEKSAKEASEKIKTLLLSLKK